LRDGTATSRKPDATALRTMAFYLDLNPVRADLISDPKDY
jgi:hypothetical protein